MKNQLNRKQYQLIRKMDHSQMEAYFQKVYEAGVETGRKEALSKPTIPDTEGLETTLQEVKGIGEAKAVTIAEKVREYFKRNLEA